MKTQNRRTFIYIIMIAGITLYSSQSLSFSSSESRQFENESSFTCPDQGLAGDKIVEVKVRYNRGNGKPLKVIAVEVDSDGKEQILNSRKVRRPYYFGREKNPTSPTGPKLYSFPAKDTGPPPGATICTKNNYPVFVYGDTGWFFFK